MTDPSNEELIAQARDKVAEQYPHGLSKAFTKTIAEHKSLLNRVTDRLYEQTQLFRPRLTNQPHTQRDPELPTHIHRLIEFLEQEIDASSDRAKNAKRHANDPREKREMRIAYKEGLIEHNAERGAYQATLNQLKRFVADDMARYQAVTSGHPSIKQDTTRAIESPIGPRNENAQDKLAEFARWYGGSEQKIESMRPAEWCLRCREQGPVNFTCSCEKQDAHHPLATDTQDANGEPLDIWMTQAKAAADRAKEEFKLVEPNPPADDDVEGKLTKPPAEFSVGEDGLTRRRKPRKLKPGSAANSVQHGVEPQTAHRGPSGELLI